MPAPANDNFADAQLITGPSGLVAGIVIDEATSENPDGPFAGRDVWYRWVAPATGQFAFSTLGTLVDGDPLVELIYEDPTWPSYSYPDSDSLPDGVLVDVVEGSEYFVHLGSYSGIATGTLALRWRSQSAVRTSEGRAWRWFITEPKISRVLTALTTCATEITTSRLLAAARPASLSVPSDDPRINTVYEQFDDPDDDEPFVAEGIRALIGLRDSGVDPLWECAYAGLILVAYDAPEEDVPYTKINAWDIRKYLEHLPLVDEDGNLPDADGITYSAVWASSIAKAALQNWIGNNPGCLASIIFDLASGAFEETADVTITFHRGTTIADVWASLEQMGVIDITLDPVFDPRSRPGVLSVVNFEVEHGTTRNSAIFSWDRSPRSLPDISRTEDGTKRANVIQWYDNDVEPVSQQTDADSIGKYGEWWSLRAWPNETDAAALEAFAVEELLFRKNRQVTITASPAAARAPQPVQDYDIGDRAPFYVSDRLRKPITGIARIYEIPITIGDDTRESVDEVIVSADAVA